MENFNLELANFITQSLGAFWFTSYLADIPIFFLPLFLAGLWLYYTFGSSKTDKRIELMYIFYACVLGIILSYIIKQFVDIERPEAYLESTRNMLLGSIPEKSFPSDHATVSFAFLTSLFFTNYKKVGYIFLPFVIIMNISRIGVGVHWPLDIIAGSLLGILSSIMFFTLIKDANFIKVVNNTIIAIMKKIHLY